MIGFGADPQSIGYAPTPREMMIATLEHQEWLAGLVEDEPRSITDLPRLRDTILWSVVWERKMRAAGFQTADTLDEMVRERWNKTYIAGLVAGFEGAT